VVAVPRPGSGEQVEMAEVPKMSSPEEVRAFFTGSGTKVVYSQS
jgi:hypothetical protein